MVYVELMRARRVLFWYGMALLAVLVITGLSVMSGGVHIDVNAHQHVAVAIKFSQLAGACAIAPLVIATVLSPSLNAEFATTAITWTRPTPRNRIAWEYVAIDVATIAVAYILAIVLIDVILLMVGFASHVVFDAPRAAVLFLLGLGGAVMWYALVSVVAARIPGRGGLIAGLSWGVFLVALSLSEAPFPAPIHAVVVALNYLNPVMYMGGIGSSMNQDSMRINWSPETRAAAEWVIALVALVAATRLWSTREA